MIVLAGPLPNHEVHRERTRSSRPLDLHRAVELDERLVVAAELRRFRVRVPPGRTDTDRAFREGAHDDLVLAVGAAVERLEWAGPCVSEEVARLLLRAL